MPHTQVFQELALLLRPPGNMVVCQHFPPFHSGHVLNNGRHTHTADVGCSELMKLDFQPKTKK